jgi:glycosyltransferase involved in cell wall biosynthesis
MARVTVGLITYNGAQSIRASIESILAQTYRDLELLIFDNASTDATSQICEEYARRDSRVTHVRHPNTIPQSANFRGVLTAATSELFMWATDDDVRTPTFVESCVAALDADDGAVAACTKVSFRTADGTETIARGTAAICGLPRERLQRYYDNPRDSSRLFGVYRTEALKRSYPVDTSVFGYDWLVVGLTMLEGDHLEVAGVGLVRTANAPGKYFERYDRHFTREVGVLGPISRLLPLLPLTRELHRHLARPEWRAVRMRMIRLNLHQTALLLRWRFRGFRGFFRALRWADHTIGRQ